MKIEFNHIPVLLNECIENLNIKPDGVYVDCTLGGAGHSGEILKRLSRNGILIAVDQDMEAINTSSERLKNINSEGKFIIEHSNFENIIQVLDKYDIKEIDGVLMDLGVSSRQIDEESRGFSYKHEAFLDMRMNTDSKLTAYDIVNYYSQKELEGIIKGYGEENWAKRIAEFIINERKIKKIETTTALTTIIKKAIPLGARKNGPHPARRTFQGIRIAVNDELNVLKKSLEPLVDKLKKGGRICVITFHSLEDRIVKDEFRRLTNPCDCPSSFPICICGKIPKLKLVNRKPIESSKDELEQNSRARSAKLRVGKKIEIVTKNK